MYRIFFSKDFLAKKKQIKKKRSHLLAKDENGQKRRFHSQTQPSSSIVYILRFANKRYGYDMF
ncbi:hypothetical protein TAF16_1377 [Anoxybacillus flavithermus]|uniref:Uncharacterized protein n=1 Tax=Anoxybacillus flavithermus TaxID=33934 RepID=A0A178TEC1_9BACL|nr:hypothetical protein TAF16_1377 [Anoxybacillus flavithermus]